MRGKGGEHQHEPFNAIFDHPLLRLRPGLESCNGVNQFHEGGNGRIEMKIALYVRGDLLYGLMNLSIDGSCMAFKLIRNKISTTASVPVHQRPYPV